MGVCAGQPWWCWVLQMQRRWLALPAHTSPLGLSLISSRYSLLLDHPPEQLELFQCCILGFPPAHPMDPHHEVRVLRKQLKTKL